MNFFNLFYVALRQLTRNKTRTFLTTLGIIIGVSSVISMIAIGSGSKENIQQTIAGLGTNVIIVFPGSSARGGVRMESGSSQKLTLQDEEALRKNCSLIQYISPIVMTRAQAVNGSLNHRTIIYGTYPEYFSIRNVKIVNGESFSMTDEHGISKVCVVGQTVVDEVFGVKANPVGQIIRLNNIPYRIIGVLEKKGQNTFGQDQDDLIVAPFSTVQKRMMSGSTTINALQQILASAVSEPAISKATDEMTQILRERHRIRENDEDDFNIRTQSEFESIMNSNTAIMSILLACIAGISLLVGGIGIMNIMLVSVTERTREIGIRMATGAKENVILVQFLIESILLSASGGIIGIILGCAIAFLVATLAGWPVTISMNAILLSFFFSSLIGVFFGWYPARKAAKLNPIEALRYE